MVFLQVFLFLLEIGNRAKFHPDYVTRISNGLEGSAHSLGTWFAERFALGCNAPNFKESNMQNNSFLTRALTSGTVSGLATSLAAALAGKRETASYSAPINATSHILWGDEAARHDGVSFKYTVTGFLLNHLAAIMWAAVHEKWAVPAISRWSAPRSSLAPLMSGAAVAAGAYVTDYYLVPKRFTPGYEKRLSGQSLAFIYGALALGLTVGTLLGNGRSE